MLVLQNNNICITDTGSDGILEGIRQKIKHHRKICETWGDPCRKHGNSDNGSLVTMLDDDTNDAEELLCWARHRVECGGMESTAGTTPKAAMEAQHSAESWGTAQVASPTGS